MSHPKYKAVYTKELTEFEASLRRATKSGFRRGMIMGLGFGSILTQGILWILLTR